MDAISAFMTIVAFMAVDTNPELASCSLSLTIGIQASCRSSTGMLVSKNVRLFNSLEPSLGSWEIRSGAAPEQYRVVGIALRTVGRATSEAGKASRRRPHPGFSP